MGRSYRTSAGQATGWNSSATTLGAMRFERNAPAKRVVILGAGFAGMSLARRLEQRRDLDVTVIDRNDFESP